MINAVEQNIKVTSETQGKRRFVNVIDAGQPDPEHRVIASVDLTGRNLHQALEVLHAFLHLRDWGEDGNFMILWMYTISPEVVRIMNEQNNSSAESRTA